MIFQKVSLFVFAVVFFGFVSESSAVLVYSESGSGDLSNSGLSPTGVTVSAGSNEITGTTGRATSGAVDFDYFTINVPVGLGLRSLIVLPGTAGGGTGIAFIGIQAGNQVTLTPPNPPSAAGLLGFRHYGAADINTDILPSIGTSGGGSSGFVPPLGPGSYSFWIQELSTGSFPYGFSLVITAVPEPTAFAMMLAGLAVLVTLKQRRRS